MCFLLWWCHAAFISIALLYNKCLISFSCVDASFEPSNGTVYTEVPIEVTELAMAEVGELRREVKRTQVEEEG